MTTTRPAAMAGRFYPDDPSDLATLVDQLVTGAGAGTASTVPPKALIVPHAGYAYSGAVAASAYASLGAGVAITRVILFAPAHRWPVAGLALPDASAFETPLGLVPIDVDAATLAAGLDCVETLAAAHLHEHAIEVQLPFLQRCLPAGFRLIPFVVGQATSDQVGAVMDLLWGGSETLLIVSSDLSHFHDYDTARRLDAATSAAIEQLAPAQLHEGGACGRIPIQALLTAAGVRGLSARMVALRNSGDTAGGRDEVVGYGAYVIG